MIKEFPVPPEYDGRTVKDFLRGCCRMSASLVRSVKFLPDGLILDGVRVTTDKRLSSGQTLRVNFADDELLTGGGDSSSLRILFENENAVVLDKPPYIATHPTMNYPDGTLANDFCAMMSERSEPCAFRPVFRLDRNTSGCLLVAKNRYAAPALQQSCQKSYLAIVRGETNPEGRIDFPIGLCEGSIIKRRVDPDGKPSLTLYRTLEVKNGFSLVEVSLVTGRTHQIRVHFSYLGYPLAGDTLYGEPTAGMLRQALHCRRIFFSDPTGVAAEVLSDVPADMAEFAAGLGFSL